MTTPWAFVFGQLFGMAYAGILIWYSNKRKAKTFNARAHFGLTEEI